MQFLRKNLVTIILAAAVGGFLLYQRIPLWKADAALDGSPLPAGIYPTLDGYTIDPGSAKNKVILLSFWATWCMPCRVEMPMLVSLKEELAKESFEILAVTDEDPAVVKAFIAEHPVNFPVLLDQEGRLHNAFQVQVFPTLRRFENGRLVSTSHGIDWLLKFKVRHAVTGKYF